MALYSFGEILYDIYPEKKCIGGAPLNLAAHFALQGNESFMLSAVGNDENGRDALAWMQSKNIRTDYVKISSRPTGSCLVTLDEVGLPCYDLQTDVAWDDIDACRIPAEKEGPQDGAVLAFGSLALRGAHNRNALRRILQSGSFREIFVDINIRPPFFSQPVIRFALENATLLKVSDEELPAVLENLGIESSGGEDALRRMGQMFPGLKLLILTCGEKGSLAFDPAADALIRCPAVPTEVVSTVGAGDSFSAVFLSEYLKGQTTDVCLARASEAAARVCAKLDAVP